MQYDKENQKTKAKLRRKQDYYTTQMFPSTKKGNKPQAPLANVQTELGQGVWLGYRQADFGCQYVASLCLLSHNDHARSESAHLCVWYWSGELGFWLH